MKRRKSPDQSSAARPRVRSARARKVRVEVPAGRDRGEALLYAAETLRAELDAYLRHLAWMADREKLPEDAWVRDADGHVAHTTKARETPLTDEELRARMVELCREGYFDRRLDVTRVLEFYFEMRANGEDSRIRAGLLADLAARAVKNPEDVDPVVFWAVGRRDTPLSLAIRGDLAGPTSDLVKIQRVFERLAEGSIATATVVLDSHSPPRPNTPYRELLERALKRYT